MSNRHSAAGSRAPDPVATRPGSEWRMQTPRLIVRPAEIGDAVAWHGIRAASPMQSAIFGLDHARRQVSEMAGVAPGSRPGWHQFMIVDRDAVRGGSVIGDIGVNFGSAGAGRSAPAQAEIGFEMHPVWRKKGIAREAVGRLVEHLLGPFGLHRIVAITDTRNADAQALLERLGFLREAHYVESWQDGAMWRDEYGYALRARQ